MTRDEQIEAVAKAVRKTRGLFGPPPETALHQARTAIAAYEATLEPVAWRYVHRKTRQCEFFFVRQIRFDGGWEEIPLYAIPKP